MHIQSWQAVPHRHTSPDHSVDWESNGAGLMADSHCQRFYGKDDAAAG